MPDSRRVVITGMGVLACNGLDVPSFWDALKNGRQGIRTLTRVDHDLHQTHFGGEIDIANEDLLDRKSARRKDRFVLLALRAAQQAMDDAGLSKESWADPLRAGVVFGAGVGGLETITAEHKVLFDRGPSRVSPFLIPKMITDSAAGDISIAYGMQGPNYCITTACATGSHCIGAAFNHIRLGQADVMLCGGSEAPLNNIGIAGFNAIKALSTRNDDPATASRPFDAERDGFVMAEGAGALVLESYDHAQARGATIYGEVVGYGCTGDAYHETAPDPEGRAGTACMRLAIADAGIKPDQVGYFNAHGTSTRFNDAIETMILKKVFGDHAAGLPISSTKSMTGHTLGAAGGVEAIATILALRDGVLPPTINLVNPDPECDLDYIPNEAREVQAAYAMSNNLGFGGHNATLVFKRFDG